MTETDIPTDLPDYAVLDKKRAAKAINLSLATLDRMHKTGEGPVRTKLSVRRVGYRVGVLREWLKGRSA